MWCPTQIFVNGEKHEFPLPEAPFVTKFPNGQGMTYEVKSETVSFKVFISLHYLDATTVIVDPADFPLTYTGEVFPNEVLLQG